MKVVKYNRTERGGNSLAAAKAQLQRPDMPNDHADHRQTGQPFVPGEVKRGPDGNCAFGKIHYQGDEETLDAKDPAGIPRPDTATGQLADILAQTQSNEIITRGEAAQGIGGKKNERDMAGRHRLPEHLLNPRHKIALYNDPRSHSNDIWHDLTTSISNDHSETTHKVLVPKTFTVIDKIND
jgi:hypothetical protein